MWRLCDVNRNKVTGDDATTHQSNWILGLETGKHDGAKVLNDKDTCQGESVSEVSHPALTNLTGDLGIGATIVGVVATADMLERAGREARNGTLWCAGIRAAETRRRGS